MATSDLLTADAWLYATLAGDPTLTGLACGNRIYDDSVPQTATFPFVQIRYLLGADTQTMNANIVMNRPEYLIVVVDRADQASGVVNMTVLETVYARIQALLHRASGSAAGRGTVYFCARERAFRNRYLQNGVEYREFGAIYRVWTQA